MKESNVLLSDGIPQLEIGRERLPACAYITYFEENNEYEAFAEAGYRLYSVTVSTALQPINSKSGFMPFTGGVFECKGEADFSCVDASITRILESCPDAYIFPRIYVTMPEWWIKENPRETVEGPRGKRREMLFSKRFRKDGAAMLRAMIDHFSTAQYADHIIGYQISGGNTQEWFHFDWNGSLCENALPYFNGYLEKKGYSPVEQLPDLQEIQSSCIIENPMLREYIRFSSDEVAETVEYLCRAAKEAVDYKQIVGVFYGYTIEVSHEPLRGSQALEKLLCSSNIDFFSSPNSYVNSRGLGMDWPNMMPADSIALHGKLCFMERDIRTHRTVMPSVARPGCDPYNIYKPNLFLGPPTEELSVAAVRKSLARQLTHHCGLWWFDMFGHWYADEPLMAEMKRTLLLYESGEKRVEFPVQVAVFVDENATASIGMQHPCYRSIREMRIPMGATGAPYHIYLLSDFPRIDWENSAYKAVVFLVPFKSDAVKEAEAFLDAHMIKRVEISAESPVLPAEELRKFYRENGVHCYCDVHDVVYQGNGYFALHTSTEGVKTLCLPRKACLIDAVTGEEYEGDCLQVFCKKYETKLWEIKT